MSLATGPTARERSQYARTGVKPAALIRKEVLQKAQDLEAEEARLQAANKAKLQELEDLWDAGAPNRAAKQEIAAKYDDYKDLIADPEFQKLEEERKRLSKVREKAWNEQTAINDQIIEVIEQRRQLARSALLSDTPANVSLNFGKLPIKTRAPVEDGRQIFADLVENRSTLDGKILGVRRPTYYGKHRAYYMSAHGTHKGTRPPAIHMPAKTSARTTVHEMGHWLEDMDAGVRQRAQAFLARRTQGDMVQRLSALTGNKSYEEHEVAKPDNFMKPYMGKIYRDNATEIISMGLEYLAFDAVNFAREDPEYFDFMVDIARGQ
jgi:hypothetical protein